VKFLATTSGRYFYPQQRGWRRALVRRCAHNKRPSIGVHIQIYGLKSRSTRVGPTLRRHKTMQPGLRPSFSPRTNAQESEQRLDMRNSNKVMNPPKRLDARGPSPCTGARYKPAISNAKQRMPLSTCAACRGCDHSHLFRTDLPSLLTTACLGCFSKGTYPLMFERFSITWL